jgi:hypothetical protein
MNKASVHIVAVGLMLGLSGWVNSGGIIKTDKELPKKTEQAQVEELSYRITPAKNLGPEKGVMRRDPSDIIRVKNLYYVWYTRGAKNSGYDASVWYATSSDGHTWTERGEALARGPKDSWEEQSVFTPNILVANEKYWLFYTAVPKPFINSGPKITKTAIGIAVSDSPDGPWVKLKTNPILKASDDPKKFDSMRVDDACLIVRDGKYWMYYKGRQWDNTPSNTRMGLAIADTPEGPYVKYNANPITRGGHEVIVWPYGNGIVALIGHNGPQGIRETLQYAEDGISFKRMSDLKHIAWAAGTYRPEAFTGSTKGKMIEWGIQIGGKQGYLPFLERFDYIWKILPNKTNPAYTQGNASDL